MTNRDYRSSDIPLNNKSVNGYLIVTSGPASSPQETSVSGTAAERFGPTIDVGLNNNARHGVLAQFVTIPETTVPASISFEIQWSQDGTTWFPAPTSAQGDDRMSTITTSGSDRSMVSRGQVLTRYIRWRIFSAANLPPGKVFLWYGRI